MAEIKVAKQFAELMNIKDNVFNRETEAKLEENFKNISQQYDNFYVKKLK